jgi:nondiscriminating glutamyl-tRNA synthetase
MTVRVRFAPSPTGFLHVGGARTALYNWLFSRHCQGTFLLRIEDTDEARSTDESMTAILTGLRWLGLDWNEGPGVSGTQGSIGDYGPYFQMERTQIYREYLEQLITSGKAYPCFCAKEDLEQMRNRAMLMKRPPKYDGRCKRLTKEESASRLNAGAAHVYRFSRPTEGAVEFNDVVKGLVRFESEDLDDFVLLKSSGVPTFMFAGAVDDHLMKITHVIRGDDHLSNTPRQIQLYQAFGWTDIPIYAHISMIMGPDGARLSKRHGATSIEEFQKEGFLPEVMLNYLALLGWSTSDSQQLFDPANHFQEMADKFELERCQKSPAVFDMEKLKWMNGVYIRKLSREELLARAWPYLVEAGLVKESSDEALKDYIHRALMLEQEKLVNLKDAPHLIDFFLQENYPYDSESVASTLKKEGVAAILEGIKKDFEAASEFTAASTEAICRGYAKTNGLKAGQVFHPVRVAVSGRTKGPSLFHMLEVMGKERSVARLNRTIGDKTLFS